MSGERDTFKASVLGDSSDDMSSSAIHGKYNFDSFICGNSNLVAYNAAVAVAKNTGDYNPLLIHGPEGIGKTHILYAIRNFIQADDKTRNVVLCTSGEFMAELVSSLRFNKMDQFRCKFRNPDVFLLDDIQFFAGKVRTQEELFHFFDTLYEMKKQIVMTSDRPPTEIDNLDAHLIGRFQRGLTVKIGLPEYETKLAFVRRKADTLKLQLSDAVVQLLASGEQVSFRELEGSVVTLSAYSSFLGKPITLELVKEVLGGNAWPIL